MKQILSIAMLVMSAVAHGAPQETAWPVEGPDDTVAVAAASLSGWYAAADTFEDRIEVRDITGALRHVIEKTEIESLLPWMTLAGGPDGPNALAWSDSGRLLFVLVHDNAPSGDGMPNDAVLRFVPSTGELSVFARLDAFEAGSTWSWLSAVHHHGRLYVGTSSGGVLAYNAGRNDAVGVPIGSVALPDFGPVRGLTVDRATDTIYASSQFNLYRSSLTSWPPSWTFVGAIANMRSIAWCDHFGGPSQDGLYAVQHFAGIGGAVIRVPTASARGEAPFQSIVYTALPQETHDIAATACGGMLFGVDEDGVLVRDTADTRLSFDAWLQDEFDQHITFAKGLISPDGEPHGWVIDADVVQGASRFHPATPDGACWVVLMLIAADVVNGDPDAQSLVRDVLMRYAGMAADGIAPDRSSNGFFEHWIDPATGFVLPGWGQEYATYSTMKIVLAADRARAFYPDDPVIEEAAHRIVCGVENWDTFIIPSTRAVYLIAQANGQPLVGPTNSPFTEGILFVEQAANFGGPLGFAGYLDWVNRSLWPTIEFVAGLPVSSAGAFHLPAFVSLYSLLVQDAFRHDPAWQTHISNLLDSNGAWTDDNAPDYYTVFSAGATKGVWGGYNADSLSNHPGDITTLSSLMAFSGTGETAPAVGAYHAYRKGARIAYASGASILHRRSDIDPAYIPNAAGLPDVGLGALGLAELLAPGFLDAHLAVPYDFTICPPDIDGDDDVDVDDAHAWEMAPSDLDRDGIIGGSDRAYLMSRIREGEVAEMNDGR